MAGPAGPRRSLAILVVLVLVVAVGCQTWGQGSQYAPLSEEETDNLYLKLAVDRLIHEVLSEFNPQALRWYFPPASREQVDCDALYQQLMGAEPGVYQPRFRDMRTLKVTYHQDRQRADTEVVIECTDRRPGSGGTGKFISLKLNWIRVADKWFLKPPSAASPTANTPAR